MPAIQLYGKLPNIGHDVQAGENLTQKTKGVLHPSGVRSIPQKGVSPVLFEDAGLSPCGKIAKTPEQ
jgi:hypothetical protein